MGQWMKRAMRHWGALTIVYVVGMVGAFAAQTWTAQTSGVTVTFRGVSAVDGQTAWVSESRGTVLRTSDGGTTWANVSPAGAETLDIRDVDAIDAQTAYALSIGSPSGSTAAQSGTSRVTLKINGQTLEGTVTVRDGPMIAEHGRRLGAR